MTRFSHRLESEKEIMQNWVTKYKINNVLDAACGTGLHAIVLSKLGVSVTGADTSKEMLDGARKNAERAGIEIEWIETPMEKLNAHIHSKFQTILCLGNSLPHILEKQILQQVFSVFRSLLASEGMIILQLLNYQKILKQRNRIISINRHDTTEFIRFVDFNGNLILFNVLKISWDGESPEHKLMSTPLHPYQLEDLDLHLRNAGFFIEAKYGNMNFLPFDENKSDNLVLVCRLV
jgi:SAM-dependent methyltransferase